MACCMRRIDPSWLPGQCHRRVTPSAHDSLHRGEPSPDYTPSGSRRQQASCREQATARPRPHSSSLSLPRHRNPLKFLLTSLSLPAVRRLRFAEMETAPPFETGRFARSPSALCPKTETGHPSTHATQASELPGKTLQRHPELPSNPSPGFVATLLQCGAPIGTDFATASVLRRETSRISAVRRT
jgi:hypothetical protein